MSVVVYILTNQRDSPSVKFLLEVFESPFFKTNIVNIDPPSFKSFHLSEDDSVKAHRVYWALKHAKKHHPKKYLIIVKDTSTTYAHSGEIVSVSQTLININGWDIAYLSKWNDRCDLYKELAKVPGGIVSQSHDPHGLQCAMISPKGRDILLGRTKMKNGKNFNIDKPLPEKINEEIIIGNISAICVSPNLFFFNTKLARKKKDYLKNNECLNPGVKRSQKDYGDLIASTLNSLGTSFKDLPTTTIAIAAGVTIFVILLIILIIYSTYLS